MQRQGGICGKRKKIVNDKQITARGSGRLFYEKNMNTWDEMRREKDRQFRKFGRGAKLAVQKTCEEHKTNPTNRRITFSILAVVKPVRSDTRTASRTLCPRKGEG